MEPKELALVIAEQIENLSFDLGKDETGEVGAEMARLEKRLLEIADDLPMSLVDVAAELDAACCHVAADSVRDKIERNFPFSGSF